MTEKQGGLSGELTEPLFFFENKRIQIRLLLLFLL
jgi:hypothetical protein